MLKYALMNCPRLRYFEYNNAYALQKILLSSSDKIDFRYRTDKSNPSLTSQEYLKWIQLKGVVPTPECLDLLSRSCPNIEDIVVCKQAVKEKFNIAHKVINFTFNLTALKKIKTFRLSLESLVEFGDDDPTTAFDYVFFHFRYTGGDEAFYYSVVQKEDGKPYTIPVAITSQQFVLDCSQNEALSTRLYTIELSNKIELFSLDWFDWQVGGLRFGELFISPPHTIALPIDPATLQFETM